MKKNKGTCIGKKMLGVMLAMVLYLCSFSCVSAAIPDANILIENTLYDSGYTYISTYQKSSYFGKSAFKLTYEYIEKDVDGKYQDRNTNQQNEIDYSDTFEFSVFDSSWQGWNVTEVGQSNPVEGTKYTSIVPINTIESKLSTDGTVQGINFETGRIGDTKLKIYSLEYVNDSSLISSPAKFTGSWEKGTGGMLTKVSGEGVISTDQWKINVSNLCVYDFKNPTVDVTVDYGNIAPNRNLQAEILSGSTGEPIVNNFPFVNTAGEVTYTTEFNKNLTSFSACYEGCIVKSIEIYDNKVENDFNPVTGQTAARIAENMGLGWNFGNSFERVDENDYDMSHFINKGLFRAVKAEGFHTIRIPVTYIDKIQADNTVDDDYLARIKQVVDYAYDIGMYVVIDMHNDGGNGISTKWLDITKSGDEFEAIKTKFAAVWNDIASNFRDYDQKLVFEGFNELMNGNYNSNPTETQLSNIDALNQAFVSAVRSAGGKNDDRVLIVAGYNNNIDQTVAHFVKPTDTAANRLMLSCHYYDPYDFTLNQNSDVKTWGTALEKKYMQKQITAISEFATGKGMPVFLGEYGPIDKDNTAERANYCYWLNYWAAYAGNVVTAYWDDGNPGYGGTALFDRAKNTVLSEYDLIISKIKQGKADGERN